MVKNYYRYKTKDLFISSFLISTGKVILSSTEKQGKEVYFIFTPQEAAQELTTLYWSDQAPCNTTKTIISILKILEKPYFFHMKPKNIFLLDCCWKLIKAIDACTDWFLVYIDERDISMKKLFEATYQKKCRELTKLAEEVHAELIR